MKEEALKEDLIRWLENRKQEILEYKDVSFVQYWLPHIQQLVEHTKKEILERITREKVREIVRENYFARDRSVDFSERIYQEIKEQIRGE